MHATPFHMLLGNTGLLTIESVLYEIIIPWKSSPWVTYLAYRIP